MKNLNSENPCIKPLFRRGGGYAASAGAHGVTTRECGEQVSTTIATFQISQLFNTIARNLSGAKNVAFTMAEILLSLTIIGVVAAITLPSLTGNINERTWNTQRKALYARFSQAIALMPSLNGYGTLTAAVEADEENGIEAKEAVDTATETFITEGLSKVLKINNICDSEHLEDCGIPQKITPIIGETISNFTTTNNTLVSFNEKFSGSFGGYQYNQIDTKAAAFETANGESILVYYNPYCKPDMNETASHYVQSKMCANFIYDLNGTKGPNTVGKDIGFISALYSVDPIVVAPFPTRNSLKFHYAAVSHSKAIERCKETGSENRLANKDELASMFYNKKLLGTSNGGTWSGTLNSPTVAWMQTFEHGIRQLSSVNQTFQILCIER